MFEEMAIALGKRKRRSPSENSTDESDTDAQAIFRRHFEARFKPLPELSRPAAKVEPVTALEDEASQWSGIESDKEEEVKVHIVQHSTFYGLREKPSRADEKAFMVTARASLPCPAKSFLVFKTTHSRNETPFHRQTKARAGRRRSSRGGKRQKRPRPPASAERSASPGLPHKLLTIWYQSTQSR